MSRETNLDPEILATQLRKPEGELGEYVAGQMNLSNEGLNQLALNAIQPKKRMKILEIGMGNGKWVNQALALSETVEYTGLDFSPDMVKSALNKNQEAVVEGKAKFVVAEAARMPLDSDCYDVVFTLNTLYFWEKPLREISEIYRVLAPGGQFVMCIRSKETMQQLDFTKFGFQLYDADEAVDLMESASFEKIKAEVFPETRLAVNGAEVFTEAVVVTGIKP